LKELPPNKNWEAWKLQYDRQGPETLKEIRQGVLQSLSKVKIPIEIIHQVEELPGDKTIDCTGFFADVTDEDTPREKIAKISKTVQRIEREYEEEEKSFDELINVNELHIRGHFEETKILRWFRQKHRLLNHKVKEELPTTSTTFPLPTEPTPQ
jgi:hypothetical protein